MSRIAVWVLALVLTFAWCVLCIQRTAPGIQSSLLAATEDRIADVGPQGINVRAEGRDIILTGAVVSEQIGTQVGDLVREVPGVRTVVNRLQVPALRSLDFGISFEQGDAVVRGTLSQESGDSVLAQAQRLFGAERVRNELRPGEAAASDGIVQLREAISGLAEVAGDLRSTGFRIADGVVALTGVVPEAGTRSALEERTRAAFPGLEMDNQIRVVTPGAQIAELLQFESIEFETNSDRITSIGLDVLERVRAVLMRVGSDVRIEVSGHTDSQADPAYNLDLSRRRAASVVAYLALEIPRGRFLIVGHGVTRPIADNDTAEGRQRNRRIEFRLLEG